MNAGSMEPDRKQSLSLPSEPEQLHGGMKAKDGKDLEDSKE